MVSAPCAVQNDGKTIFSMLKAMFDDLQVEVLADIIQTALMLRINKRIVG